MTNEEVAALASRYLMGTYRPAPVALVRGEGALVWDADGRRYVDMVGGIATCVLGHGHPDLAAAIADQAGRMLHVSNLYLIGAQAELARELCQSSFGERVFFANSGTEAVEGAIKLARKHGGGRPGQPHEIVSFTGGFHGRTLGALAATASEAYQKPFRPLPDGFGHLPWNDVEAAVAGIGPATAAVLVEPVQGEAGIRPASAEFLAALRQRCDEVGALLMFDEIQCGMGRTGTLWAYQQTGVVPDVMTLAKGLAGGVPIGAVVARGPAATALSPGDHGSTFGGNPLACRAGLVVLEVLRRDGLPERAARLGERLLAGLRQVAASHPDLVREVRGRGLMVGMELTAADGTWLSDACRQRGVLVNCTNHNVIRLVPPLVVDAEQVDLAVAAVADAMAAVPAGRAV